MIITNINVTKTPAHACQYGHALALISTNKYTQASAILTRLLEQQNSLYFQIAMAQAETGLTEYKSALSRLEEIQKLPR